MESYSDDFGTDRDGTVHGTLADLRRDALDQSAAYHYEPNAADLIELGQFHEWIGRQLVEAEIGGSWFDEGDIEEEGRAA